jgi:hypothetical protein
MYLYTQYVFSCHAQAQICFYLLFLALVFWFLWRHILQFVFKNISSYFTGFALVFKLMFWLVSKFAVWFILWPTERVLIATPLAAKRHISLLRNDRRCCALCIAHSDGKKKVLCNLLSELFVIFKQVYWLILKRVLLWVVLRLLFDLFWDWLSSDVLQAAGLELKENLATGAATWRYHSVYHPYDAAAFAGYPFNG